MLVLSRKAGQKVVIEGGITVMVTHVAGNHVKLGIEAPDYVRIIRGELKEIRDSFEEEVAEPTVAKIAAEKLGTC
jgi:carbon storage regulator